MKSPASLLCAIALAAGTLLASAHAHAVGRLLDVDVIDRDTGAPLPVYRHGSDWWIAGRPGARYAIQVRNASGERVMGVMSVDGVNVITGDTAAWDQSGYVLSAWQNAQITGWRKSDAEVAAFHFTTLPHSYAARTGRPANVGVIGVAVFRERLQPPPPPIGPMAAPMERRSAPAAGDAEAASPAACAEESQDKAVEADRSTSASAARPRQAAPHLGTGHGARESAWVSHTRFERRSPRPQEVISIRYDSHENLVAMGVIAPDRRLLPQPQAFPDSASSGYTPDPPAWR
ncbi:hypothetical protein [Ottowia sp.]|uniref:hypothetical protein n=1 Tax=Ottowia sp. TaxID=1898956 RepID=UPI0039446A27